MISSLKNFSSSLRRLTGFVFDIDGVLLRGSTLIPRADEAIQQLYKKDKETIKHPLCFLTNGGGVTEAEKASQLSAFLGVKITEQQVVLCHTPMRDLISTYGNKPVLLCGKGDLNTIAASYGFSKTVTTQQLSQAMPTATPLTLIASSDKSVPCPIKDLKYGTKEDPFASVMVFTDPLDWCRDIQLITDVVTSHGIPGHKSSLHDGSWPVKVYIGAKDLLWANEFPLPRYGLGAFSLAFQSLFKAYVGSLPTITHFGKPTIIPFKLAENLLMKQVTGLGGHSLEKIYMIGDNPASDIRGAKNCGHPWISVLVKTGVSQSHHNNIEEDQADIIFQDVFEFMSSKF